MTAIDLPVVGPRDVWGAKLNAAVTAVATDAATETAARSAADSALQAALDAEGAGRAAADTALVGELNAESAARAAADAAEATARAAAVAAETTARNAALALKVGAWKANTAYVAGQYVVNPAGQLASAKVDFTSGAAYSSSNWNEYGASTVEAVNTVAATGSTETLPDVTTATIHRLTLDANCTLTFPAAAAGKSFTLVLVQDATGNRTVTWPSSVKWPAGVAPGLSTGGGKVDYLSFICTDGTNWAGFLSGLDVR